MQARVTVVEQVSYQGDTDLAFSQPPFTRMVSSEQPYQRVVTIGEEWVPLDLGWVKEPGMVLVANKAPVRQTYPTPEEAKVAGNAVVELTFNIAGTHSIPNIEILVGEDTRICPLAPIMVRCRSGRAQIVVTAIPK